MNKILTGIKTFVAIAIIAIMVGGCCDNCKKHEGCCSKDKDKPCSHMTTESNCAK